MYGRPEPPKRPCSRGWPYARGSLRHALALREASGDRASWPKYVPPWSPHTVAPTDPRKWSYLLTYLPTSLLTYLPTSLLTFRSEEAEICREMVELLPRRIDMEANKAAKAKA